MPNNVKILVISVLIHLVGLVDATMQPNKHCFMTVVDDAVSS